MELTYSNAGDFDATRVSFVRSRGYDIAIDLSVGQVATVQAFLARLAPIQVNYLIILHLPDCLLWIIG